MAATNPEVLIHGEIREISRKIYNNVDPDTGEMREENRGRKVTVLTRTGFLQLGFPASFDGLALTEGQPIAVWAAYVDWNMNNRRGNSLIFNRVASPAVVAALHADAAAPAVATTETASA